MTRIATLEGAQNFEVDGVIGDFLSSLWSNASSATGEIVSAGTTLAEAQAAAVVIASVTGIQPSLTPNTDGSYTLSYSGDNATAAIGKLNSLIAAWKNDQATAAQPKIKYSLSNVIVPVLLKQSLPYLLIAALAGGFVYAAYKGAKK